MVGFRRSAEGAVSRLSERVRARADGIRRSFAACRVWRRLEQTSVADGLPHDDGQRLVNIVHKAAPHVAIAFNTRPEDTADVAARQLKAG
jgi:hypothetical protein